MIIIDSKTPLDLFEFGVICYCPDAKELSEHGLVINRMNEFEYLIGRIDFMPDETPSTKDWLFDRYHPGMIWRCPEALKEALLDQTLLFQDIISHWLRADESIGLINTAFKVASLTLLNDYFPRKDLVIQSLNTIFLSESQLLKEIPLRQSAFFKDQYEGQWIISRINVSLLCLVQVFYEATNSTLKLISEAFMINELALLVMKDQFNEMEWEELTLAQVLLLKNVMQQSCSHQELSEAFKQAFRVYPMTDVQNWMSPLKLNLNK